MNKRNGLPAMLLVLSLILAACGGTDSASPATSATETATASTGGIGAMQGELSTIARDMLGIFKLEGTDLAFDADQAAASLPLWQAYRSLLNSDTTAAAELEALATQIDEALTAEQHAAIAAMNLTPQDLFAMAEELGVAQSLPSAVGTQREADRPGFAFGGGGPGGAQGPRLEAGAEAPAPGAGGSVIRGEGGGMPFGEAGAFDPSMMTRGTPRPGQGMRGGMGDRLSQRLLDPLIDLLKERAAS